MAVLVLLVVLVVVAVATRSSWREDLNGREPGRASDAAARWRRREQQRARRREQARRRRLPALPAADAPPDGLAPLVPSPRTMRSEAARGLRELELWLAEQTSA